MIEVSCPRCQQKMKAETVPVLGPYWTCPQHGNFTNLSFFKNHATRHAVADQILEARRHPNTNLHHRKLKCPVCQDRLMQSTLFHAQPENFYIDQCSKCDHIWLDTNEMKQLFFGSHVRRKKLEAMEPPTQFTIEEFTWTPDTANPFYYLLTRPKVSGQTFEFMI